MLISNIYPKSLPDEWIIFVSYKGTYNISIKQDFNSTNIYGANFVG